MNVIPEASQEPGHSDPEQSIERVLDSISSKYEKVRLLGHGGFGQAWIVKRVTDSQLIVAKIMNLSQMSDKDSKYVKSEICCLAACDHFAIIKYYEHFTKGNFLCIIMEFANAGDLNMQIKARAADNYCYFNEHEVGYTFVQLAMAIAHIHRKRMLHRDIKGANVFLMTTGFIRLGDFGFSQQYENTVSDQVASTFCGTFYYLAPEVWKRKKYSNKADIWAMGILLFEMMALTRPFCGSDVKNLMEAVLSGKMQPLPEKFSEGLKEIVKVILVENPNKRPGVTELFQLPQMVKLLSDFEKSMKKCPLISDAVKDQIQKNICEVHTTTDNLPVQIETIEDVRMNVHYEGAIRKEKDNKVWKDRYLILRNNTLFISLKKGDKKAQCMNVDVISSVVPVSNDVAGMEGVFLINTTHPSTIRLQAPNVNECNEWIHHIQQAMKTA